MSSRRISTLGSGKHSGRLPSKVGQLLTLPRNWVSQWIGCIALPVFTSCRDSGVNSMASSTDTIPSAEIISSLFLQIFLISSVDVWDGSLAEAI